MSFNNTMETGYGLSLKGQDTNNTMETSYDLSLKGHNTNNTMETSYDLSLKGHNTNNTMETSYDLSLKGHYTNNTTEFGYGLSLKGQETNNTMGTGYDLSVKWNDTNNPMETGYDLSVKGHDSFMFYPIHSVAISSIMASLICASLVFVFAIRRKTPFFKRLKCERFIVYLSICDGCFNIFHLMDHMQYIITKSHPSPIGICSFYAFMMCVFVMAQMLCVNVIAINTFRMAYFGHKPSYGKRDYQLLIYMFGVPLCMAILFVSLGQFGPNGYFCGFDGVKGGIILLLFTTVPTGIILAVNSVLYILTWSKIHQEAKKIKGTLGKNAAAVKASHSAAISMSILVGLFFIQWIPSLVFGVWDMVSNSPAVIVLVVVLTSNAGGVLNGIAYVIIHKNKGKNRPNRKSSSKRLSVTTKRSTCSTSKDSHNMLLIKKIDLSKVHTDGISVQLPNSLKTNNNEQNQQGTLSNDAYASQQIIQDSG